jgi:hypothetical protein
MVVGDPATPQGLEFRTHEAAAGAGQGSPAAAGTSHGSPAVTLAGQVPGCRGGAADWPVQRAPAGLLRPPRDLTRRVRGLVLFGAALAGVIAGCLTRGISGGRRRVREVHPPLSGAAGMSTRR